jgi:hypothetical protein
LSAESGAEDCVVDPGRVKDYEGSNCRFFAIRVREKLLNMSEATYLRVDCFPLQRAITYMIEADVGISIIVDCIYPIELEIEDTTDTARSALCLDLHFVNEAQLRLKLSRKKWAQFSFIELCIFALFVFFQCLVYLMLPVSLNCLFLIAAPSNVLCA